MEAAPEDAHLAKILLLDARRRGLEKANRALTDYYNYLVEDEEKALTSAD
jgi:hypothetical protein